MISNIIITIKVNDKINFCLFSNIVQGADETVHLVGVTGADDGAGDRGVAKGPCDGRLGDRATAAVGDATQHLDKLEALGQQRLAERRIHLLAPVGHTTLPVQ